jgi:hypothetical protein
MCGACNKWEGEEKYIKGLLGRKYEGKGFLEELGADGKTTLIWTSRKEEARPWSGLIWLRINTGVRPW